MKAIASAPAKIILAGEHFVVYGEPAIVMAIDCYAKVSVKDRNDNVIHIASNLGFSGSFKGNRFQPDHGGLGAHKILEPIRIASQTALKELKEESGLNIVIKSEIPVAAGLGSSGALAVATVAAVGKFFGVNFTKEKIVNLSFEAERFVHGKPSGIDQAISTNGGIIVYKKNQGITPIKVKKKIPIIIGNTGELRSTGDLVKAVKIKRDRFPKIIDPLIKTAGHLTTKAIKTLKSGDLTKFGELMNINHGLLSAIGVSNKTLDNFVHVAIEAGALGAKLTGAGGGGCMIALSPLKKRKKIAKAIKNAGGTPIISSKVDEGVKSWIQK